MRKIAASDATVVLFTVLERTGAKGRTADVWAARFRLFNDNDRSVGAEVGAIIADANEEELLSDRRFLAQDRLHLNPIGHDRVAQAVLEKLGLPFASTWRTPLPPKESTGWLARAGDTNRWFVTFLAPWIWRRIRGRSSGDGRMPKHSEPIFWPNPRKSEK